MQSNSIEKYLRLRRALEAEREQLTNRLNEVNAALNAFGGAGDGPGKGTPSRKTTRVQNELSLKEAILRAIKGKSLSKDEVYDAILKLGYRFNTGNPLNSIGTVLYGKNPKFKNVDGKFSLP